MINTKIVLLFIIIIMGNFATLSAQDCALYFPTGMKWKEVIAEPYYLPLDTTRAATWEIGPDTTVNNLSYKQVVREGKTINIWLREDAGKVWLLTEEYPREILLYNFNWIPDEVLYEEYIRETDSGMEVFKDEFSLDDYKTTTCGNHSYEYIFGNDHTTIRGIGRVAELHRNSGLLGYSKMKTILPGLMFFKVLWIVRDNKEVFRSEIAEEWTCEIPVTARADVEINEENFPDENFRNWVLAQSYGQDGVLTNEEIENVKSVDVSHLKIRNLNGLGFFIALTDLFCSSNYLTELDLSRNTALVTLDCKNNSLTTINVSKNSALLKMECGSNQLTTLDVSECTDLMELLCSGNQLTSLDVSRNTALTKLECYGNQLKALDLTKNTALTWLRCNDNQVTTLDVSKNIGLTWLTCNGNQLTVLDVSKNPSLSYLQCMSNRLETLNVSNIKTLETLHCFDNHLTTLDVSGCTALTGLDCNDNHLSTLDVSGCTALTAISCNHNQLTSLDLSEVTTLTYLSCMQNQIKGEKMTALVESLPTVNEGKLVVIHYQDEQNVMTKAQVAIAKAKGWQPQRWQPYILWTDYEGIDMIEPITFTAGQMATIILPTEPDASKGRYYCLAGCKEGEIVFEQEQQPRAHVPYIIVPSEDFSIDPASLELAGLTGDTVSVEGVSFIGTYVSEVLPSLGGDGGGSFYYDIIDQTSDCSLSPSGETGMQAVVGALRAYLLVDWKTTGWNDPYTQGGTKAPWQKMPIVLRDTPNSLTPHPSPRRGEAYDLQGRRISEKPSRGIYIEGGKVKARP